MVRPILRWFAHALAPCRLATNRTCSIHRSAFGASEHLFFIDDGFMRLASTGAIRDVLARVLSEVSCAIRVRGSPSGR